MRNKSGFTLMELTIVLAILAVIAAILIPVFLSATDRARLRADIHSARVIHNAMELYRVEQNRNVVWTSMANILTTLSGADYLQASHTDIQTTGAVWETHTVRGVVVNITASPSSVQRAYNSLSDEEKLYVVTGTTPP
jgi:prepilin-type N-terminal cleavage/methylation domain-containing protein